MRLLMLTRKVDCQDASPAGFTYNWVKKIGEKLDKLYVIAWQKSDRGNLPKNIEIISLPKSKFLKVFILQFKLLAILPKIDGVFCHQNPEYTILSAPLAKIFNKKIIAWYTHGSVSWRLKLVNLLADKILTASEESCRLKNRKKIKVVGHGVDTEYFKPGHGSGQSTDRNEDFNILSVGRISPVKNYGTLIQAIDILVNQKKFKNLKLWIIGAPGLKGQEKYLQRIKQLVKDKNLEEHIDFLGAIPHNQILFYYRQADLFVNLSQTGSIDKAVLEAMACQRLVVTSNQAFEKVLPDKRLFLKANQPDDLAEKIIELYSLDDEEKRRISRLSRQKVVDDYNLEKLIKKIAYQFKL